MLKDDCIACNGIVETSLVIEDQGRVNGYEGATKEEWLVVWDDTANAFIHENSSDEMQQIIN